MPDFYRNAHKFQRIKYHKICKLGFPTEILGKHFKGIHEISQNLRLAHKMLARILQKIIFRV